MNVRMVLLLVGMTSCTLVPDPAYDTGSDSSGATASESSADTSTSQLSSSTESTSSESTSSDGGDETTDSGNCGNDLIDAGEQCDGTELGDQTCISQGFGAGSLSCEATCAGFDTTGCLACGDSPTPPGGQCPPVCSSCDETTCFIECLGKQVCTKTIECPAGWDCDIACNGTQACQDVEVRCDDLHACTTHCTQTQACQGATIVCGAGPCTVECDDTEQECQGLSLQCGSNVGQVICAGDQEGVSEPTPFPDGACLCTIDPTCGRRSGSI